MAQHDYIISNQTFPNTRADINNLASAIATNNSGTSAPTTQYAGQFWIDTTTTTWTLYIHDGTDDIQFATIDTTNNTVNFIDSTFTQLTSDLATNGNNINFGDNDKANFGASSDLQIYHDGSDSYIDDVGAGNLIMKAGSLRIKASNDESMIDGNANGSVNLYYDNSKKFETTSTGVDVRTTTSGAESKLRVSSNNTGDNDATVVISNGGTGDAMLRFDYEESYTDRARLGTSGSGQNLLFFTAGNNERMRIDSSGNVGIGTSSPDSILDLTSTPNNNFIHFNSTTGGSNGDIIGGFEVNNTGGTIGKLTVHRESTNSSGYMAFQTATTEKMRITNGGNVLIGTTNNSPAESSTEDGTRIGDNGGCQFSANGLEVMRINRNTNDGRIIGLCGQTTVRGEIAVSGTVIQYTSFSDHRLKQDVQQISNATESLKQLNPVNFAWIDGGVRMNGFLAHEVQSVVPEAVTGTKDEVDADGNPKYQGIDQSKLVPLLVASLKEALTEIDNLKARVNTLEGN